MNWDTLFGVAATSRQKADATLGKRKRQPPASNPFAFVNAHTHHEYEPANHTRKLEKRVKVLDTSQKAAFQAEIRALEASKQRTPPSVPHIPKPVVVGELPKPVSLEPAPVEHSYDVGPSTFRDTHELKDYLLTHPDAILGNKAVRDRLCAWCKLKATKVKPKKAPANTKHRVSIRDRNTLALLTGSTGVGKTLTVEVAVKQAGMNANFISCPLILPLYEKDSDGVKRKTEDWLEVAFAEAASSVEGITFGPGGVAVYQTTVLVFEEAGALEAHAKKRMQNLLNKYPSAKVILVADTSDMSKVLKLTGRAQKALEQMHMGEPSYESRLKFMRWVNERLVQSKRVDEKRLRELVSVAGPDIRSGLMRLFTSSDGLVDRDWTLASSTDCILNSALKDMDTLCSAYAFWPEVMPLTLEQAVCNASKGLKSDSRMQDVSEFYDSISAGDVYCASLEWVGSHTVQGEVPMQMQACVAAILPSRAMGRLDVATSHIEYPSAAKSCQERAYRANTAIVEYKIVAATAGGSFSRLDLFSKLEMPDSAITAIGAKKKASTRKRK